jgi:hypothetical protein
MQRIILRVLTLAILATSTPAWAQHAGGEAGGSSGCGDLFGDLIHILRRADTGQPILQKAWVAVPKGGFDWAYCPIPVNASGEVLPFTIVYAVDEDGNFLLDDNGDYVRAMDGSRYVESCDVDPAYGTQVVAVDYFGRLSGGRTKERNIRMHLDEVISNIKMSQVVSREATGRLLLGNDCKPTTTGTLDLATCTWKAVDSPQENIALYQRIIKYGHIQTNPLDEVKEGNITAYRPALDEVDRAKFRPEVQNLLSGCLACYTPEDLTKEDFILAAGTLSAAADKTGSVTVDLVQYMNRIVRVGLETEFTKPAKNLLPALYMPSKLNLQSGETEGAVYEATGITTVPANEQFLDFTPVSYRRDQSFNFTIAVIKPAVSTNYFGAWLYDGKVPLLTYLAFANPSWTPTDVYTGITGFVRATNDGLRTTEFFHNYALPADLGWDFKYKVK